MPRYALVIDCNRCVGCHTCAVACRAAFGVPLPHNRLHVRRLGPVRTSMGLTQTFQARQCVHCRRPACVAVCPVDPQEIVVTGPGGDKTIIQARATWKDPATGIVRIDAERCIGCGSCVDVCPYEARFLIDGNVGRRADGCDFCYERLTTTGKEPVCVESCLTGARIFGDLDDPTSRVAALVAAGALALEPAGKSTGPALYYTGRPKDLAALRQLATPTAKPPPAIRRKLLSLLVR